jgi:hypothetical protein
MKRHETMARGSLVAAVLLNAMQDQAVGLRRATGAAAGARSLTGADGLYWTTADVGLADGAVAVVDASVDWRQRAVWGRFTRLETAAQRSHGAEAWQVNDPARGLVRRDFEGRTGSGGVGAVSAVVSAGTPPVVAAGSFAVVLDERATSAQRVWLYARPTDGVLGVYNASGATLHAELLLWGASAVAAGPAMGPGVPWRLASAEGFGTVDDVWTTAVTMTPAAVSMNTLQVSVAAVRSDGARGGGWMGAATFRGGAPPVQVGPTVWSLAESDDPWAVRVVVLGGDVVVQVRGGAATNVKWFVEVMVTQVRG